MKNGWLAAIRWIYEAGRVPCMSSGNILGNIEVRDEITRAVDEARNFDPLTRLIIRSGGFDPPECQHLPSGSPTLGRYGKIFEYRIRGYYEDRIGSGFYFPAAGVPAVDDGSPDFVARGRLFAAYDFRISSGAHLCSCLGVV